MMKVGGESSKMEESSPRFHTHLLDTLEALDCALQDIQSIAYVGRQKRGRSGSLGFRQVSAKSRIRSLEIMYKYVPVLDPL